MRLLSWNMNRRASNWNVLVDLMLKHDVTAAMLQEAVAPPNSLESELQAFGDPSLGTEPWQMPIPSGTRRPFASALAARRETPVTVYEPKPLAAAAYGQPAISHPGQWVAASIGEPDTSVWLISLYGMWDSMSDSGDIFAEPSLHRAVSDLTPLLQEKQARRVVLAGDLNIWRGYGPKKWARRYRTVFDRIEAYQLGFVGPKRTPGAALPNCPCKKPALCEHVQTYRYQRRADSTPYQNDYMFARGVQVLECIALNDYWEHSDHCPILLDIDVA